MPCVDDLERYITKLEGDVNELKEGIRKAIRCIEGLAEQQAMPDDWYQKPLQELMNLV